jgi:hypothetical protein
MLTTYGTKREYCHRVDYNRLSLRVHSTMDAPALNTPAIGIQKTLNEKEAESLGASYSTVAPDVKVNSPKAESGPREPAIRLPQNWSSKQKWLIVTTISLVSFIV